VLVKASKILYVVRTIKPHKAYIFFNANLGDFQLILLHAMFLQKFLIDNIRMLKFLFPIVVVLAFVFVLDSRSLAVEEIYSVNSLFIGIFSNGDALVQHDIKLNSHVNELSIKLLGENITNLSVKNYSSHDLSYYVIVDSNELRIKPQGSQQIRITYLTPTIVDKKDRIWTFSVNSSSIFTVKLPNDAAVTSLGLHPPKLIRRLGEQELLSFDPGKVSIKYILGLVGTKEQAQTAIDSADIDIRGFQSNNPGIHLNGALEILQGAKISLDRGDFANAERLATNSSNFAKKIFQNFELAENRIKIVQDMIKESQKSKIDTIQAQKLISESTLKFSRGNYSEAIDLAGLAQESISAPSNTQENAYFKIAIVIGVVVGVLLSLYYFGKVRFKISNKGKIQLDRPKSILGDTLRRYEGQLGQTGNKALMKDGSASGNQIAKPRMDVGHFNKFVETIIRNYPDLKQEDREVLHFLAEKEGAVFEGEIRTKFLLPKTSVWRLVKRLERLELIEVTKIGGQNLLKLRSP
jgi:uncharacterized membrane protein